ncbi:MAG: hypothetical protein H6553_08090 [Chitinophagales bacterium]|nr:hypothetical protein [Chitinophagales bacterium]
MKNVTRILCSLLVVLAVACSKEGPVGPAGQDGIDGVDGNANVMYSDWFASGTWSGSSGNYYFNKSASAVTQDILDQGVVLAFAKLSSDGSNIRPLPANASGYIWNYVLTVGNIQFTTDFSFGTPPSVNNQFRYVIIPSTTHLRLSKPLTEYSYHEICTMYNIPE